MYIYIYDIIYTNKSHSVYILYIICRDAFQKSCAIYRVYQKILWFIVPLFFLKNSRGTHGNLSDLRNSAACISSERSSPSCTCISRPLGSTWVGLTVKNDGWEMFRNSSISFFRMFKRSIYFHVPGTGVFVGHVIQVKRGVCFGGPPLETKGIGEGFTMFHPKKMSHEFPPTKDLNSFLQPMDFNGFQYISMGVSINGNLGTVPSLVGEWFGTFYIFPYIGNNHPNWLIFFRGVQTTNQFNYSPVTFLWLFPPKAFEALALPEELGASLRCLRLSGCKQMHTRQLRLGWLGDPWINGL